MTRGKNSSFVDSDFKKKRGGHNDHHRLLYAAAIPEIAYIRMKTSGKCFVYDNRRVYDKQQPIAEIDDTKPPVYKLIKDGKVIHKGTLKDCLLYSREHLLEQANDSYRLRRRDIQTNF